MNKSPSLAARAVLAVVLMVGFYVLALAIAGGLLYLPYAEVVYAHRIHLKLALVCVVGAAAILWSVLPRADKFEAPGPALTPARHPRLFDAIQGIARATGQAMPAEVYLVPDVNAWVAQRGGFMGFASRRVMGLGLPLLRVLTCAQFRAVLAHEFGHYHGGDTKLGPWVFKTRAAIGRTLASLGGGDGKGSLLQLPFLWYGKLFLRITHAISRRQEFVADELAARTVGARPLQEGLRTVHGAALAFDAYWQKECSPVLGAGFRPPLVEGFDRFIQAPPIAEAIHRKLEEEMQAGKADPYDTHPPLKERTAALAQLPAGEVESEDPPALSLLEEVPLLEQALLSSLAGPGEAEKLQPIGWDEVGVRVYLPQWQGLAGANAAALNGMRPDSLPASLPELAAFGRTCVNPSGEKPPDDDSARGLGAAVLGAALALVLARRGARADSRLGGPVYLLTGSAEADPFDVPTALAEGKLSPADWRRKQAAWGIEGADLASVVPGGSSTAP